MRWMLMLAAGLVATTGCATYEATYGPDPEDRYEAAVAESEKAEREEMRSRELQGQVVERSMAANTVTIQDQRTNQTYTLTLDPSSSIYAASGERLGTVELREGTFVRAAFDMMLDELRAQRIIIIGVGPAQPVQQGAPPQGESPQPSTGQPPAAQPSAPEGQ